VIAAAQICEGRAPFARGPFQAAANLSFRSDIFSVGAGLGAGTGWAFGQLVASHQHIAQVNKTSSTFGGRVGLQARVGPGQRRVHVCPVVTWSRTSGPKAFDVYGDGYLWDVRETDHSFGLALGVVVSSQGNLQVVPVASLTQAHETVVIVDRQTDRPDTTKQTFSMLGLGFGLVFNDAVSLRPILFVPLNKESVSYGINISVNF
jgi:hypothetical protein